MCFPLNRGFRLATLTGLCLLLQPVIAFERVDLSVAELTAADWRAEQLRLSFTWPSAEAAGYLLKIGQLESPSLQQPIKDIQIDCRQGRVSGQVIRCEQGEIRMKHPLLEAKPSDLTFDLDRTTGRLNARLVGVGLAGGRLDLDLNLEAGAWELQLRGQRLHPSRLTAVLPPEMIPLPGWSYAGQLDLTASLQGHDASLFGASWQLALSGLSFSDATGSTAGEGLGGRVNGKLQKVSDHWQVNSELILNQGELLTPVCYLNAAEHPLRLENRITLTSDLQRLTVQEARLRQQGLLDAKLQGEWGLSGEPTLHRLKLEVQPFQAADLYRELLQPVLEGTAWGRFELAGQVQLSLALQGNAASLDLKLQNFHLDDGKLDGAPRRMGLYGVNGHLAWNRTGKPRPSWLQWQAGHVLERIDIGPARIDFQTAGERFTLGRQIRVPVLDGFLQVDRLDIQALGKPDQKLAFDGLIEPISMAALSEALGWPPLSGKLSGMLPGLTYKNGVFSLEGVLLVRMFDGDILIKRLRVQDLFGVYPQLQADVDLDNLDLETLTGTFSFGKITGRLDGYVRGLNLEAWRPVSFDARFVTPQDDKSRHRISQKAVDNISNLGGAGLSGTLARSFLGMFEEFHYRRLGIGCRLRDGICDMVGVGPAKQGYYLMEGSGIPRIDIIGYNKTADWNRLVEQLKQIMESGTPVIQ